MRDDFDDSVAKPFGTPQTRDRSRENEIVRWHPNQPSTKMTQKVKHPVP